MGDGSKINVGWGSISWSAIIGVVITLLFGLEDGLIEDDEECIETLRVCF